MKVDRLQAQLIDIPKAIRASSNSYTKVLRLKTLKRTSSGIPTEPRILRGSHSAKVSEDVSIDSIPRGALHEWREGFEKATPGVAREILVISESKPFLFLFVKVRFK